MPYQTDAAGVHWSENFESGFTLRFSATEIRRTNTGIHSRIAIYQDQYSVAYDTFNIGRDPDRTRLSNAAHMRIGTELIAKKVLAYLFDDFCAEVWPRWVEQYQPTEVSPSIDELAPVKYILEPYIIDGGGTIMFAPPGHGKSYLALLMAQSINQGCSQFWNVSKRRVLYINLERGADSLKRRLLLVNQQLGLPPETPMAIQNARGRSLTHVIETVREGYDVVFLDSLSRGGFGSLVDDEAANSAMDAMNGVSDTWAAIGHTPRGDSTHVFGSQMFDGAADLTVQVISQTKEDASLGVGLQGWKANDVPKPKLAIYTMAFDSYGLSEFRLAKAGEFPEVEAGKKISTQDAIRGYLLTVGEADIEEIAEATNRGRSTVDPVLKADSSFQRRRDGKRFLYSVRAEHASA